MAPPYLTGNVYYQQDVNVLDVNTMIASIKALGLAATPAWTNPSGNTIVSPADADGRKMTIAFTRIAATNLEFTVTDGQGRTLTRRAQINAAGSTVTYYLGQFHMIMDWLNGATPEGILCVMLDESPEIQTSHDRWVVATSSRNAADANDSGWVFGNLFIIRSGGTFAVLSGCVMAMLWEGNNNAVNNGNLNRTGGGSNIWCPMPAMGDSVLNVYNIYGRLYQCLNMKSQWVAVGSEVSVPIDSATSVIFKMLQMPSWTLLGPGTNTQDRMCVRKT